MSGDNFDEMFRAYYRQEAEAREPGGPTDPPPQRDRCEYFTGPDRTGDRCRRERRNGTLFCEDHIALLAVQSVSREAFLAAPVGAKCVTHKLAFGRPPPFTPDELRRVVELGDMWRAPFPKLPPRGSRIPGQGTLVPRTHLRSNLCTGASQTDLRVEPHRYTLLAQWVTCRLCRGSMAYKRAGLYVSNPAFRAAARVIFDALIEENSVAITPRVLALIESLKAPVGEGGQGIDLVAHGLDLPAMAHDALRVEAEDTNYEDRLAVRELNREWREVMRKRGHPRGSRDGAGIIATGPRDSDSAEETFYRQAIEVRRRLAEKRGRLSEDEVYGIERYALRAVAIAAGEEKPSRMEASHQLPLLKETT